MRVIIRTVPSRKEYLDYLLERIPNAVVYTDHNKDAMALFIKALDETSDEPGIYLEDDILLCEQFMKKCMKVITSHPNTLINFFSRRGKDLKIGPRMEPGSNFNYNCCNYLPPGYAKALVQFYPNWPRRFEHPTGYDLMMADWMTLNHLSYYLHVPSLVQHREGISAINTRRNRRRMSSTFKES